VCVCVHTYVYVRCVCVCVWVGGWVGGCEDRMMGRKFCPTQKVIEMPKKITLVAIN